MLRARSRRAPRDARIDRSVRDGSLLARTKTKGPATRALLDSLARLSPRAALEGTTPVHADDARFGGSIANAREHCPLHDAPRTTVPLALRREPLGAFSRGLAARLDRLDAAPVKARRFLDPDAPSTATLRSPRAPRERAAYEPLAAPAGFRSTRTNPRFARSPSPSACDREGLSRSTDVAAISADNNDTRARRPVRSILARARRPKPFLSARRRRGTGCPVSTPASPTPPTKLSPRAHLRGNAAPGARRSRAREPETGFTLLARTRAPLVARCHGGEGLGEHPPPSSAPRSAPPTQVREDHAPVRAPKRLPETKNPSRWAEARCGPRSPFATGRAGTNERRLFRAPRHPARRLARW